MNSEMYSAVLWNNLSSEAKKASSLYQFESSMPTMPDTLNVN